MNYVHNSSIKQFYVAIVMRLWKTFDLNVITVTFKKDLLLLPYFIKV